ncbi:LptF/LptG family permease [Desulfonatronovibrio hydrogenovorans]|uniref:LptF/LptG family permease n=1 Tax=Desulfonatronovibrio hydrogenovorans TaxID=53245 RepID=UPI00048C1429|nr:LptF/LptG family permease [Desulfonatronovibrio hydrogenovorans]
MFTILNRYLFKQNLFLMLIILFSGIAIYLIVDFLTRMNAIVDSGIPMGTALMYFLYKIPLIIAQIMPAIFMLAVIVQVALMFQSNEMVALETNSISFVRPAGFFIVYSLLFFIALLFFSETMGIKGYQETKTIWDVDIRQRDVADRGIEDLWFKEGQTIVFAEKAWPKRGEGRGITVYQLDGSDRIREVIQAGRFTARPGEWILENPVIIRTHEFQKLEKDTHELVLKTDLSSFSAMASRLPYESLSIFTLGGIISDLRESGSNVERLATAWHSKIAYAFALVVMTILALALATLIRNIYALVTLSLVIVFLYYTVYVFGVSYAEEGIIAPVLGAWLANIVFGVLGLGQILWSERN